MLDIWKADRYFIVFDLETIETPLDIKSEKTEIISKLSTLSIATCYHMKDREGKDTRITTYHDLREGEDFVKNWIREVIEKARKIYRDNLYYDEDRTILKIPKKKEVAILGYNSARFDTHLIFKELHNPKEWYFNRQLKIKIPYNVKRLEKEDSDDENDDKDQPVIFFDEQENEDDDDTEPEKYKKDDTNFIYVKFLDIMNFSTPMPLREFVKTFRDKNDPDNVEESKGYFAYEAINSSNYDEVLSKKGPFTQEDFYSSMTKKTISDEEYKEYIDSYNEMTANSSENDLTRWEQVENYNKKDVEIMIKPILFLIDFWAKYRINMLDFVSLASCSQACKYNYLYKDININNNYKIEDVELERFVFTKEWMEQKCKGYEEQDKRKKRDTHFNVKPDDINRIISLAEEQKYRCYFCNNPFTDEMPPTFDRIKNYESHTLPNIRLSCCPCNCTRGNRQPEIAKARIVIRNYAILHKLQTTLTSIDTIKHLERTKFGGLSNVMHRVNIGGVTKINKFKFDSGKVMSYDTENTGTNVASADFNGLYPSVMSSTKSELIPYTGGVMYMPGRFKKRVLDKKK
jgi:hypothetical protein